MATRRGVLTGFVRIDATNKVLRVRDGGGDTDRTLTEGVYWVGLNGAAGTTPAADASMVTAATSLMTHISSVTGWDWVVEHPYQDALTSPTASGHVHVRSGDAADVIYWGHASTTVDPAWFGVASSDGVYPSHGFSGTGYEDVSQHSSGLVYISNPLGAGNATVEVDREIEDGLEVATQSTNGRVYSAFFAQLQERVLTWRIHGLQRVLDNPRTAMRLFLRYQRRARALGFIYWPDLSLASAKLRVEDDTQEARRFGFERYVFSPKESLRWDPQDTFPGYANITTREMRVTRYALG